MEAHAQPQRIVPPFVVAGTMFLGLTLLLPWQTPLDAPALAMVAAAHFLALVMLQRVGFVLAWGRHSTKVSLEEFAVLVGLLALPPVLLVANVVASTLLNQVATRRPVLKSAFNVAQYGMAAAAAAIVFTVLVDQGVHPVLAAASGPLVFSFTSQLSLAYLLARLEGASVLKVFHERFLLWTFVTAAVGISVGLAAVGLYAVHPVTVLALAPLFLLMTRYGRLTEWAEGELRVRLRLADVSTRLAGRDDVDEAAREVLGACADVFEAGGVRLVLRDACDVPREWLWRHPQGRGGRPVRVVVPMARGGSAEIEMYPRPSQRAYGQRDLHLLEIVAGTLAAAAANVQAINESREAMQRLGRANRELEEFTLWTTHDMREPLRSVGALARILEEDIEEMSADETRDLAARIRRGADGLKDRIKALHEFSVVVQEDAPFETVDVEDVFVSVSEGLEVRIRERNARLVRRDPLPCVRAQRTRFEKVLANLVENAMKYNDKPEPVVEVSCRDAGHEWELSVRDNGPGVDPLFRDRVFQLFQRGPNPTQPGSGAGLAIVKRIVEQHGGRAWVQAAPGGGADFRFTLPKSAAPAAPAAQAAAVPVVVAPA